MKWYVKYGLLLACVLILLVVPLIRFIDTGDYVGTDPYLFVRLAENPELYDSLSFSGRSSAYNWGLPLVMSISPGLMVYLLPFLLGFGCFVLFWLILKKLSGNEKVNVIAMILLLLSPTFIYLFSFANSLFFPTFLALFIFYLFLKKSWLAVPLMLIMPFFNIILTASLIALLFIKMKYSDRNEKKLFVTLLLSGGLVSVFYYGYFIITSGLPVMMFQRIIDPFKWFIFDFGSGYGLGIFLLALVGMGILIGWRKKYENKFLFPAFLFLAFFSYVRQDVLVLLNFLVVFIAAFALYDLTKIHRWSNETVKQMMTIILICGIVFSGIAQMDSLISSEPSKEMTDAMDFLSEQEKGVVFTDYNYGVWMNYVGMKNVIDENYKFAPNVQDRLVESKKFYMTRDIENATEFIEKYDVDYVLIDEEMREDIWKYDTQGLLFLLEYTNKFNKVYSEGEVEIWEIEQE